MTGDFKFQRPGAWLASIAGFFRLASARRIDRRGGILPPGLLLPYILIFGIAAIFVTHLLFDNVYLDWTRQGNAHQSGLFGTITHLGDTKWILMFLGCQLLAMTITPVNPQHRSKYLRWYDWILTIYFVFTAIIFSGLLSTLIKNLIGRARPVVAEADQALLLQPFGGHYDFASFPSGHSTTAGAVFVACFLLFPRISILVLPVCVLVAASRCFIGVHFPTDVVGGVLLGSVFTWL